MRNWNKIFQQKKRVRFCYSPEDTKNAVDVRIKYTIDTKKAIPNSDNKSSPALNKTFCAILHRMPDFDGLE